MDMGQKRAQQTHVSFRSAYNLAYKAAHSNDDSPTFVSDKDAYACNLQFMQEYNLAIEIYEGKTKKHSYGMWTSTG